MSFPGLFTEYGDIIFFELFDTGVGQRMFGHRFQNLVRYGGDVRACQSAVSHMDRVADAGGDDLRLNAGNGKNICDLAAKLEQNQ